MMTRPEPWDMAYEQIAELTRRVEALEDRNEVARAPGLHGCEEQCPDCAMACDLKHYTDCKQLHHDTEGHVWSVPECCGRGPACGACDERCACGEEQVDDTFTVERGGTKRSATYCGPCCTHGVWNGMVTDHCQQCDPEPVPEHTLDDHCPTCFGCCGGEGVTDDPEPVPPWRDAVDSQRISTSDPLAAVLYSLHQIAQGTEVQYRLARIVAVAEREVGDGWKADPLRCFSRQHSAWKLLGRFGRKGIDAPSVTDWMDLADAASHWLCDLTQDGAE